MQYTLTISLIFTQALFSHSYPQAFWPRVEGVYNAMDYVKGVSQAHHRAEYERRYVLKNNNCKSN
jgi:hypothetical protein